MLKRDDALQCDDALHCERVVRGHARTFTLASYFLPPEKRRAAYALYAFCRVADDIVDAADDGEAGAAVARRLAAYERELAAALAGRPADAVFRELAWAVGHYRVPSAVLHELLAGVARDLHPTRYETWAELARYCEGVASTVGEMCTHVFGVRGGAAVRDRALRYARTLGIAMQLTNILRDAGEDAERGRCYLPEEDLVTFGISRDEVLARAGLARDARWHALMGFEIRRARALYDAATPGIALLAPDAQRCASACARGYAGILSAIEANAYDTLSTRARLGHWARVAVLWDVWRGKGLPTDASEVSDSPVIQWDGGPKLAATELVNCA